MKKILLLTILLLIFSFQLFSQENTACPTVKIISPTNITSVGESMTFSVSSTESNTKNLEYKWTVSAGTVIHGQGTADIVIATNFDLQGQTITATVEIKGLPEGCENKFTEFGEVGVKSIIQHPPIIRYRKLSWEDEMKWILNLLVDLENDPESKIHLIFSIKNDSELKLVKSRQKKILALLRENSVSQNRIVMEIFKRNYYETIILIIPEGEDYQK